MSFLDRIRAANGYDRSGFRSFEIAGQNSGWLRHAFAERLTRWPEVFRVEAEHVALAPALNQPTTPEAERSQAVAEVLQALREEGVIPGWRGELYPLNRYWADPPVLLIERAASALFGICAYSVHMNGFVCRPDGLHMWVARRSWNKPTEPGKLDQLVAGGQPWGIGLRENLVKECGEEAGIAPAMAVPAQSVGAISYVVESSQGLRPDVIFTYDLELPTDFVPRNTDGEVEEFFLWPIERVIGTVRESEDFKFNCSLVIIDFLIRHGILGPEHPDYVALQKGLRTRDEGLAMDGLMS